MSLIDWARAYPGAAMIALVGLQYAGATAVFVWTRQPWAALTYLGYAVGNIGLTAIAMGQR